MALAQIAVRLIEDALRWLVLLLRPTEAVRAENLFLRRELAMFRHWCMDAPAAR